MKTFDIDGNLPRRKMLKALGSIPLAALLPTRSAEGAELPSTSQQHQAARLQLIPSSLMTDQVDLDIRGAVENASAVRRDYKVSIYFDMESPARRVYSKDVSVPAHTSTGIYLRYPMAGWAGRRRVIFVAAGGGGEVRSSREIEVLKSDHRSTATIGGAWVDILHWSEAEGRYYNAALRKLTCADWHQQLRGMHSIRMDVAVIQSLFLNNVYYGKNTIATAGYRGKALYPSELFPGRVPLACHDPLEAILSEADRLHMSVFAGVGMYAWFDYSAPSLEWHKKVVAEIWRRYGHHPSLYGWYVAEEVDGGIGDAVPKSMGEKGRERYRQEIIAFFKGFQGFCRKLAPEKPVMLACNTFGIAKARDVWPRVLKHVDIICPFGFARMPKRDLAPGQAAEIWQTMCHDTGANLWMDMETFVFKGRALVPRPIKGIVQSLQHFRDFEKIICYEYSGIFNSPESTIKPGGPATVALYRDYQRYLRSLKL